MKFPGTRLQLTNQYLQAQEKFKQLPSLPCRLFEVGSTLLSCTNKYLESCMHSNLWLQLNLS